MLVQVKVNSVEYVAFNFNIVAKYICVMGKCIPNVTNVNLLCNVRVFW